MFLRTVLENRLILNRFRMLHYYIFHRVVLPPKQNNAKDGIRKVPFDTKSVIFVARGSRKANFNKKKLTNILRQRKRNKDLK